MVEADRWHQYGHGIHIAYVNTHTYGRASHYEQDMVLDSVRWYHADGNRREWQERTTLWRCGAASQCGEGQKA